MQLWIITNTAPVTDTVLCEFIHYVTQREEMLSRGISQFALSPLLCSDIHRGHWELSSSSEPIQGLVAARNCSRSTARRHAFWT